jgi:hypothetical protein
MSGGGPAVRSSACKKTLLYTWWLAGLFFLFNPRLWSQDTKPTLQAEIVPKQLSLNMTAELTVTVTCSVAAPDQTVEVAPPPNFSVTPTSAPVCSSAGIDIERFVVQTPHIYLPPAEWTFIVSVSNKSGKLASVSSGVDYGSGLSLWNYFVLGVMGIALGYAARLVVDSLNALPKPVLPAMAVGAPGGGAPDLGWFSKFIRAHYYLMDFLVTLVLGFLALVALVKDNHAPDSGLYWYSAVGLGFGIGLLTNSDLITRLRTK